MVHRFSENYFFCSTFTEIIGAFFPYRFFYKILLEIL